MAYYFRRSVLPTRLVTHQAMFSQPQKFALSKSNPVLFQSSLSRFYIKLNNVSCSAVQSKSRLFYYTKANENNKESVEKNENVEEKEETIVERTGKHDNEIEKTPPPPSRTFSDKSSPYFAKFAKDTAESLPTVLAYYFVGGIAFFISGDNLYSWYVNFRNECLLNKTMEKGTRPETDGSDDELVPRPEVLERLMKILQPHKNHSFYHMVCGEHGTGKTTLTRMASREAGRVKDKDNKVIKDGGMGIIYVDVPANPNLNKFGDAFVKAINFTFEEHISYTKHLARKFFGATEETNDPKWERAMDAFKRVAEAYKAKHDKPPVIVYDNVSRLVHKNPEILDILQDDAKDNADDRKYIAVFVSSEGSVPRRMESRSAWSRAKQPVIEIGDLSEKESMEYLIKKRKINEVEAKKLYELVGGRIVELKDVADDFLTGQSFEVIKQSIFTKVEKKFNTAQLLRKQLHHEVGKKAIKAILDSKELGFTTFMEFFNNYEEASKVLETNIFAYHPEKNNVSFQSQSIECYIREKKDIFIK
ncbi:13796_t:CDS:2 [Funneliformis caledonium]|uniref:13796_t:CDS:1 n=1 Tax=Funneliformis caledonium TaxID=1117310 RepID=A0A9N9EPG4_9GLOM|nr:13796_t:CDS:2 [Funneliformis caledonium]